MFSIVSKNAKIFEDNFIFLTLFYLQTTFLHFRSIMAFSGQERGTRGHTMALFDSHTKCACCREKGVGSDACVEKRPCQICDSFSEEKKKQFATPTYRVRKELQKKTDSFPPL